MRSRSVIYILLAILLAVVLLVAGGLSWWSTKNPQRLIENAYGGSPTAAIFLPRQSPLVLSLLVNPDQLESFQEAVSSDRQRTQTEWMRLKQGLVAGFDLDYERDVQPWLGNELTAAITTNDLDRDPENGLQPGYLLVAATQDAAQSEEFLELFWQKQATAGATLAFEQYKGVRIVSAQPSASPIPPIEPQPILQPPTKPLSPLRPALTNLATAAIGDQFLLVANHPQVLRAAINAAQATDAGLFASSLYQSALQTLTDDRVALVIANLPSVASWLGIDGIKNRMAAISISLERQGLRLETIVAPDSTPALPVLPSLKDPVPALQYLPAASVFSLSSVDLQQLWTNGFAQPTPNNAALTPVRSWLTALQTRWGFDLSQEIATWVKRDYALGAIRRAADTPSASQSASQSATPASPPLDWIFVAQRSPETADALARLDAIARQQGLSIGTLQLEGQLVYTWTALAAGKPGALPLALQVEVKGAHTTVGDYELFATSLDAIAQALQAPTKTSLRTSERFQTAIASLPTPNSGYVYLNWVATNDLLEQQFPILKFIKFAGSALFSHLQSVTISSYEETTTTASPSPIKGEVFIQLGE